MCQAPQWPINDGKSSGYIGYIATLEHNFLKSGCQPLGKTILVSGLLA